MLKWTFEHAPIKGDTSIRFVFIYFVIPITIAQTQHVLEKLSDCSKQKQLGLMGCSKFLMVQ
jgi:arginine decarboxylase-like protein